MALWQLFKAISLLQDSTENVCRIYSISSTSPTAEELVVLSLRVAFAKWIEDSIDKVSPINFTRGLKFQVKKALAKAEGSTSRSICRAFCLSKYKSLLSDYEERQNQNDLYSKFVKCLGEEYILVRLRSMESGVPNDIRNFIEAQGVPAFTKMQGDREINNCKNTIIIQVRQLQQLEVELTQCYQLFETSVSKFEDYNVSYYNRDLGQEDLGIAISQSLLEWGTFMLHYKAQLETKIQELCRKAAVLIEQLQTYLHQFERLHTFSRRGEDFEFAEIENMAKEAIVGIQLIDRVLPCIHALSTIDYERIWKINHDVIISTQRERADLFNRDLYTNKFVAFNEELRKHKWSIYQMFTMVVDRQLSMVVMTNTRRSMSIRVFNLNNVLSTHFEIKAYLVNEATVKHIRSKNLLPSPIPHAGIMAIDVKTNKEHTGKRCNKGAPKRIRSTDKPTKKIVGQSVVTLKGQYPPEMSCYPMELEVIITDRVIRAGEKQSTSTLKNQKKDDDSAVTSEKCALLFVLKLPFENEDKEVWAISSPLIIVYHSGQIEKGLITIAWDDAFPIPNRKGFEVEKTANWSQIISMLDATFTMLIGKCGLKQSHLENIRIKAQTCLGDAYPNKITKKALSDGESSFWSWFYKAMMVIKVDGPFHEAWTQRFIEGFISFDAAKKLLCTSNVKPGTFIIRFSDHAPGSLTLVFIAFDRQIYKMLPVEVWKPKSKLDSAEKILGLLSAKECSRGMDVFLQVFPNIPKRNAFKKYYDLVGDRKIVGDYIRTLNMLPPSSIDTNSENAPSGDENSIDSTYSGINDGTSNTAMQIDHNVSSQSTDNYRDQAELQPQPTTFEGMDIEPFDNNDGIYSDAAFLLADVLGHSYS